MKFTTKTEYGLICLVYLAKHRGEKPLTAREIVLDESYSSTFIEKILQKLRKAGIVAAHHGMQGGYTLAKDPSEITFRMIVEALEGKTFEVFCDPKLREKIVCTHFSSCNVKSIWHQTKQVLDNFFDSITLETLVKNTAATPIIKKEMAG